MYHGNASLSAKGPLSVAVPGEIKGYQKAKEMFGNPSVSWESLIRPSIDLARNGIPVTFSKANALRGCSDRSKIELLQKRMAREIFPAKFSIFQFFSNSNDKILNFKKIAVFLLK